MNQVISTTQAKSLLDKGAQLVDVRTQSEFEQDAVNGAVNIPINRLLEIDHILDVNKPIIVYCRTGGRSGQAFELLRKRGFPHVHNAGALYNLLLE